MRKKLNITIAKNRILVLRTDLTKTKSGIYLNNDKSSFHVEGKVIFTKQQDSELFDLKTGDVIVYDKAVEQIDINNEKYDLIYDTNIKYIKNV